MLREFHERMAARPSPAAAPSRSISDSRRDLCGIRAASDRLDRELCPPSVDLVAPVYRWFTEGFDTADLKEAKALPVGVSG